MLAKKATHLLGGIFIVAGTAIGASMLAMPMTALGLGFLNTVVLLLFVWAIMLYSALLTAELLTRSESGMSLAGLCGKILGKQFMMVPIIVKSLLFFSLLAVYMTAGSSILSAVLKLSSTQALIAYLIFFGGVIVWKIRWLDLFNRFMLMILLMSFVGILCDLAPAIQAKHLFHPIQSSQSDIVNAVSVFFTAYGFHGSIPMLVAYFRQDHTQIKRCFKIGSLIILIVYGIWQATSLGALDPACYDMISQDQDLGIFLLTLGKFSRSPETMPFLIATFSFCAIVTSFFGVGVGQRLFIHEMLDYKITSYKTKRIISSVLTLFIPFVFAYFYPKGFILALKFAGIWLCILALLLPSILTLKMPEMPKSYKIGSVILIIFSVIFIFYEIFRTI